VFGVNVFTVKFQPPGFSWKLWRCALEQGTNPDRAKLFKCVFTLEFGCAFRSFKALVITHWKSNKLAVFLSGWIKVQISLIYMSTKYDPNVHVERMWCAQWEWPQDQWKQISPITSKIHHHILQQVWGFFTAYVSLVRCQTHHWCAWPKSYTVMSSNKCENLEFAKRHWHLDWNQCYRWHEHRALSKRYFMLWGYFSSTGPVALVKVNSIMNLIQY
jgi:hypothetical protein